MGAPVLLSPIEWDAIKIASIRGVSDDDLAAEYEISSAAIRKRRSRDKVWAAVASKGAFGKDVVPASSHKLSQESQIAQKAAISVADSIREKGENCRLRLLELGEKGIAKALKANLQVREWSDAKIITEIVGKAANWASEAQGPSVQVLFASAPPSIDSNVNFEKDVSPDEGVEVEE